MKYFYLCGGGWYNSSTYTTITDRDFTSVPFNGIGFRLIKRLKS